MPRFNPHTGEAVMGVGNGPLSVDGRQLRGDGGGPSAWLDADRVLHQIHDRLHATNVRTGQATELGAGVNEVSAGGCGTFLAWSGGLGLWGDLTLPAGGLNRVITDGRGANSADGCLVYIPDRQSEHAPTIVRHPNGTEAQLPNVYGLHVLRWGVAVWNAGPGTLGFWGDAYAYLPGAAYVRLADLDGDVWLTYFLEGVGLIAHRGTAPTEYHVVTPSAHCYHHDALGGAALRVAYSTTSGEGPDHLVVVADARSCETRPFEATEIPIEICPVNRAVWLTAYDDKNDGSFPRNCAFDHTFAGDRIFHYATGNPDGDPDAIYRAVQEIKDKIARGELEDAPVCPYVPHGVAFPSNADWIGIECYWKKPLGETIEVYESSRRARIAEAGRPVILIPQTYFSNANNAGYPEAVRDEIRQIVPVIARLTRDHPSVQLVAAFSAGSWRGTGYDDPGLHGQIAPLWEEMASTISSPDGIEPPPSGGEMITLTDFDRTCDRSDPNGHGINIELENPPIPCHVTVGLDDGEEPMGFTIWTSRKSGHYFRGIRHKPGVNGDWPVVVRVLESAALGARVVAETRSSETVEVTSGP